MILNNSINAGNFIYCMAHFGPNETTTYLNDGHGHYHQCVYVVDGQGTGTVTDKDNNIIISKPSVPAGELDDSIGLTKGCYHTITTADSGLTIIMFNPIPVTRKLDISILKTAGSYTVSAEENRKVLVCITGPIQANDKQLSSLQHAKIFPGKTVNLVLPENTVCAVVSE